MNASAVDFIVLCGRCWNAKRNWFGYKDVTEHPAEPEPNAPDYEPQYEPEYEAPQYETQTTESQPSGSVPTEQASTGELFYPEEEIVTGS